LGEPTFVSDIVSQANEKCERKHELKRFGYDLNRIAVKMSEIYDIDIGDILMNYPAASCGVSKKTMNEASFGELNPERLKGEQQKKVKATGVSEAIQAVLDNSADIKEPVNSRIMGTWPLVFKTRGYRGNAVGK
jgi:hypothetical protein